MQNLIFLIWKMKFCTTNLIFLIWKMKFCTTNLISSI